MRIAIHQQNFFPWVGLFHRISLVDKFIFFDHVQALRGKSWLSRNKILLNGEIRWLTVPVKRSGTGFPKVSEVCINYETNFGHKHLGTLRQAYKKCVYFKEVYPSIEDLYSKKHEKLSDFNKEYICLISKKIGLTAQFLSSTELVGKNPCLNGQKGNEIIVNLCLEAGANEYISGIGCLDFIIPSEFEKKGIRFQFQDFVHPEYKQVNTNSFIPNLSSLDTLFNVGFEGLKCLLNGK